MIIKPRVKDKDEPFVALLKTLETFVIRDA